jgi:MFS family permease
MQGERDDHICSDSRPDGNLSISLNLCSFPMLTHIFSFSCSPFLCLSQVLIIFIPTISMSHESLSISVIEPSPRCQTPPTQHHDILHDIPLSEPFPEGGFRAWLVVFGAFSIIMSSFGLQSAIGIFQSYWATDQLAAYSSSEIGWISAVNIFITLIGGVQVGPLFDARGARELLLLGSVFHLGALVALEWCTQYWHFMLVWGIISGVGNALLTTTGVAVVAHWFELRRGQANGIVFIGSSLGGIVYPVIMNPLFEKLGWAWAMRVLTLIILLLIIIGNVCIKGRLPKGRKGGAIDLRCFKDTRFVWACVGIAGLYFSLFCFTDSFSFWPVRSP